MKSQASSFGQIWVWKTKSVITNFWHFGPKNLSFFEKSSSKRTVDWDLSNWSEVGNVEPWYEFECPDKTIISAFSGIFRVSGLRQKEKIDNLLLFYAIFIIREEYHPLKASVLYVITLTCQLIMSGLTASMFNGSDLEKNTNHSKFAVECNWKIFPMTNEKCGFL